MKLSSVASVGGLIFLLASGALFVMATVVIHVHNWTPLIFPVTLVPGEIRSPEFTTDLDSRYLVAVRTQPNLDMQVRSCLMGIYPTEHSECAELPRTVDFEWEILEKGKAIQRGSYYPRSVMGGGLEVTFATFRARRGGVYTILMRVAKDAGRINTAHPTVAVTTAPEKLEDVADTSLFLARLSKILAGVGLLLLSAWLVIRWRSGTELRLK